VWEVLNDPAQMAKLMPGVDSFEIKDDRHWSAKVKVPLGMGGLPLTFNFEKTDERRLEYARLHAKGQGVGAIISLDTAFHLTPEASGTGMKWEADVGIAGPVGGMGQRVLQPIVNQQVGNVLSALERQVQEANERQRSRPTPVAPASSSSELYIGSAPSPTGPVGGGEAEHAGGDTGDSIAPATGAIDTVAPTTEGVQPVTDPELKDAGPPAEVSPDADPAAIEGSSGAEQGLNPWDNESYSPDPHGPRTSTEG
ncbi:MAG: SRPBCC domain-containing protein, partial [Actinomycetota bacterium]|nr:SRPBCC domain-containing protein [Actinomycetota bacterium]